MPSYSIASTSVFSKMHIVKNTPKKRCSTTDLTESSRAVRMNVFNEILFVFADAASSDADDFGGTRDASLRPASSSPSSLSLSPLAFPPFAPFRYSTSAARSPRAPRLPSRRRKVPSSPPPPPRRPPPRAALGALLVVHLRDDGEREVEEEEAPGEHEQHEVQHGPAGDGVHRRVHDWRPPLERDALENREPGVRDVVEVNQAAVRVQGASSTSGRRGTRTPASALPPPRAVLLAVPRQEHVRPDRRVVGAPSRRVDVQATTSSLAACAAHPAAPAAG